jgi:hypothetical protein
LVPDTPAIAVLPVTPPIGVSQLPTDPSRLCDLEIFEHEFCPASALCGSYHRITGAKSL